jgi:hypothetical protein
VAPEEPEAGQENHVLRKVSHDIFLDLRFLAVAQVVFQNLQL